MDRKMLHRGEDPVSPRDAESATESALHVCLWRKPVKVPDS
jgi:hypothetical protein